MDINLTAILPEIILSAAGTLLMMLIPGAGKSGQGKLGYWALAAVLIAFVAAAFQWGQTGLALGGMVYQDSFGHLTRMIILLASATVTLTSIGYLRKEGILEGEFFCLVLFATVGMCFMATSADLIMTFIGLETLSIATYVLAGYKEGDKRSSEAAWKYFILGAFSTAIMLYGIAFVYGATGTSRYPEIASALAGPDALPATLFVGLGLILVGFGFKVAMAPFHAWAPDVYQGAPLPVTAHLAVGSKAAAFFALLRVFQQVTPSLGDYWNFAFWTGAVLTMIIGNVAALSQTNIKRLLAYSSIAHAGYLMIGMASNSALGAQGILFYLASYSLMTLGAFTVVQTISRKDEEGIELSDFSGLGFRRPFVSVSLSVFLISMAGIPSTAGFMGKFFLLSAAVEKGLYVLVVIAVLTSAIGLYYYLRVIVNMFMHEGTPSPSPPQLSVASAVVIGIMLLGTLFFGLYPAPLLELASEAIKF